jgi:hypothetical protein
MSEYERIEYRDHEIVTGFESDDIGIFNPRDNDGNLGVMHCAHRRYDLGDEQTDPSDMIVPCPVCSDGETCGSGEVPVPVTFAADEEVDAALIGGLGWTECPRCETAGEVSDPIRWAVEQGATVVLGLYLYDHSGITMRASTLYRDGERVDGGNPFTCRWDSGMVGIMFDTPEGVREQQGIHEPDADGKYVFTGRWHTGDAPDAAFIEAALHSEVKVYDAYLTGDIMWYRVEGDVCDDACGGFFPDENDSHDYVVREAKAGIDAAIKHEAEEREKIGRMMAL